MATFTITLAEVYEIEKGDIGLDEYPIFDEEYRKVLNKKFLDRYWNQEIGMENISMFKLAIKRRFNEIMPYWNEQYKLNLYTVDPLSTVSMKSITETGEESAVEGESKSDSASLAKSRAVSSDTPQTQLSENQDYASGLQDNISESEATGVSSENQKSNQKGTAENNLSGYQGHAPMLIMQARQALVNVDVEILDRCQDLFMLLWSNHDSYYQTQSPYFGGYGHYGYRFI